MRFWPKVGVSASDSSVLYVDTSALARILLDEPGAFAVSEELSRSSTLVASQLLRTELRRVALRTDTVADVDRILAFVSLMPMTDETLAVAGAVEPAAVGTLDAIHLATALEAYRSGVLESIMTFDRQLAIAAAQHGLTVVAPSD